MINTTELKIGEKVNYSGYRGTQNGKVKSITDRGVFVVFNCAGQWDNYKDYTAELCGANLLNTGWKHDL